MDQDVNHDKMIKGYAAPGNSSSPLNACSLCGCFWCCLQWEDDIVDVCDFNYVSGNTIETNGNECVDVKEGSTYNVIESNICSMQLDENSGCFSSRGDANTFR